MNASVSGAHAKGAPWEPQFEFQQKFALALMRTTLNEEGKVMVDSSPATRRSMAQRISVEHKLMTKDLHCSTWKNGKLTRVKDSYPKQKCKICSKAKVQTHSSCNKEVSMCRACHIIHVLGFKLQFC